MSVIAELDAVQRMAQCEVFEHWSPPATAEVPLVCLKEKTKTKQKHNRDCGHFITNRTNKV